MDDRKRVAALIPDHIARERMPPGCTATTCMSGSSRAPRPGCSTGRTRRWAAPATLTPALMEQPTATVPHHQHHQR